MNHFDDPNILLSNYKHHVKIELFSKPKYYYVVTDCFMKEKLQEKNWKSL